VREQAEDEVQATAAADELATDELMAGAVELGRKVRRYAPRCLAVLGIGAYRSAFGRRDAAMGLQEETIGRTRIWILPNPSGLNAHYTLPALARAFEELRLAIGAGR
jgi:TDG/mug DNA glycosylase family protein